MSFDNLITSAELSALTGYPQRRLQRAAARGEIPFKRDFGGVLLFDLNAVKEAIARIRESRPAEPPSFSRVALPDRIARVYVAGPSAEIERSSNFINAVRGLGIAITHDWTPTVREWIDAGRPMYDDATLEKHGRADLAGVAAADALVLLCPMTNHGAGYWTEQGAALALRKPVILVEQLNMNGPVIGSPVFAVFCHRFRSARAALRMLRERAPKGGA